MCEGEVGASDRVLRIPPSIQLPLTQLSPPYFMVNAAVHWYVEIYGWSSSAEQVVQLMKTHGLKHPDLLCDIYVA